MSEYTQEDLERAQKHNAHKGGCTLTFPSSYVCYRCDRDARFIAQIRAEAQQALTELSPCGKHPLFFWVGEQHFCYEEHECQQGGGCYPAHCRICDESSARLAAAEKLARAALGVPSPDEEGVCVAGCGKMDLCEETIVQHSGDSYKRYFFKHVICWYAQLVEALAEWKEAVK